MPARVLLIEDNTANRELVAFLLGAFGHEPIEAIDGERGWEAAAEADFDLCLCDVQLPGISGYEIARRWRSEPRLSRVPLVAVTALARPGDRESLLRAGFDGYIVKPIDPETFIAEIEAFLPDSLRSAPRTAEVSDETSGP